MAQRQAGALVVTSRVEQGDAIIIDLTASYFLAPTGARTTRAR